MPALTLAVLLSIDTLKTCVVLDALTRSRHNSNRELIGQGLGNLASAFIGGVPGAGTMGATLVNMSSGAQSRFSGVFEGILTLAAFLVLGKLIAWVPIAALAAILIVIGVRMIDRTSLHFLKSRSTILDFVVIAAVIGVALTVSLIAASGVGIALAILLFIREQIGGSIVRRKSYGNQTFSKQIRLHEEMRILEQRGDQAVIFRTAGKPVLRHHGPALHRSRARSQDADLRHPRYAARAVGGRHRRAHARADREHAGRTQRLPDF